MAKGRRLTFHTKYTLTRPTGPSEVEVLEIWRQPGRTRQDAIVTSGAEPVHTIGIADGKRLVACRKTGTEKWNCERVSSTALDPDATFAAAIGEFGNRVVTPRDETVAGHVARCFAIEAGGTATQSGEVCVSTNGVPLRITGEGASMEVVTLDSSVEASDFKAPA